MCHDRSSCMRLKRVVGLTHMYQQNMWTRLKRVVCHAHRYHGQNTCTRLKGIVLLIYDQNACTWIRFKIQDYYLIREIKMWLNINYITVHSNTHCIFLVSKNSYCKYKSYIINKLVIYISYTHAHTCACTHTALMYEHIYLFRNDIDCIRFHYIRFQHAKSSTRWKKLIIFTKDTAVVIHNHLRYHTAFIQPT